MKKVDLTVSRYGDFLVKENPEGNYEVKLIEVKKEKYYNAETLIGLLEQVFPDEYTVIDSGLDYNAPEDAEGKLNIIRNTQCWSFYVRFQRNEIMAFGNDMYGNKNYLFSIPYSPANSLNLFKKIFLTVGKQYFWENKLSDIFKEALNQETITMERMSYRDNTYIVNGFAFRVTDDMKITLLGKHFEDEFSRDYIYSVEYLEGKIERCKKQIEQIKKLQEKLDAKSTEPTTGNS